MHRRFASSRSWSFSGVGARRLFLACTTRFQHGSMYSINGFSCGNALAASRMACSMTSQDSRGAPLGFCSWSSAARSGRKVSFRPCRSVVFLSSRVTRKIWLTVLSAQSSRDSGAWRLAVGIVVPAGQLTSGSGMGRFRERDVPDVGVDVPELRPSCEKGFVVVAAAAGEVIDTADVMLILARFTSGSLGFASLEDGTAGGFVGPGDEEISPSGFGVVGFDEPSF